MGEEARHADVAGGGAPPGALGVLGGMGPAATADFLRRLAEVTPAQRDQDHIPLIVYADPTTPDRSDAVEHGGEDPLPKLLAGIRFLDATGVGAIAIPCNSAHLWYEQMQAATSVPIIHIADAVIQGLEASLPGVSAVALLGTEGTLRSRLYQDRLEAAGYATVAPSGREELDQLMAGIRAVKAGDVDGGRGLLSELAMRLLRRGGQAVVVACTDISVAFASDDDVESQPLIDANAELARVSSRLRTEDWAQRQGPRRDSTAADGGGPVRREVTEPWSSDVGR